MTVDTELLHSLVPFAKTLDVQVISADPDRVQLGLEWRGELCTAGGAMHGGALMALADTAGAVVAYLNLPEGAQGTTTVESKTNLIQRATEGQVVARAVPLHLGRSLMVLETELVVGDGLVAKTTQTQAILAADRARL